MLTCPTRPVPQPHPIHTQVALSKPPGLQVLPAAMFHDRTVLGLLQRHYGAPAVDSSSNTTGTTPTGTTTKDVAGVQGGSGDVGHGCTCQGAGAETGASRGRMQEQQKQKEAAAQRRRQQQQQQQLDVPVPVHRLGRGTSGGCGRDVRGWEHGAEGGRLEGQWDKGCAAKPLEGDAYRTGTVRPMALMIA